MTPTATGGREANPEDRVRACRDRARRRSARWVAASRRGASVRRSGKRERDRREKRRKASAGEGLDGGAEEKEGGGRMMAEEAQSVGGASGGGAGGDEVGAVGMVAEDVGVDLGESDAGIAIVQEAEHAPLRRTVLSAGHRLRLSKQLIPFSTCVTAIWNVLLVKT